MKLKAAISDTQLGRFLRETFGSAKFAQAFLEEVVGRCFGAKNPTGRPAEYYVQLPDTTVAIPDKDGAFSTGVELRLTGVSRGKRKPEMFHEALNALNELAARFIREAQKNMNLSQDVQLFTVIMLDGEVPKNTEAGAEYTSVLEHDPEWVLPSA